LRFESSHTNKNNHKKISLRSEFFALPYCALHGDIYFDRGRALVVGHHPGGTQQPPTCGEHFCTLRGAARGKLNKQIRCRLERYNYALHKMKGLIPSCLIPLATTSRFTFRPTGCFVASPRRRACMRIMHLACAMLAREHIAGGFNPTQCPHSKLLVNLICSCSRKERILEPRLWGHAITLPLQLISVSPFPSKKGVFRV